MATCAQEVTDGAKDVGHVCVLGYSVGCNIALHLIRKIRRTVSVSAYIGIDPGLLSFVNEPVVSEGVSVRIIATSVMHDVSIDLDTHAAKLAMEAVFPSYRKRFEAAAFIEHVLHTHWNVLREDACPEVWESDFMHVLLLISTEKHGLMSKLAGGTRAEAEWVKILPSASIQHVFGSNHIQIPYEPGTAFAIQQFLHSLLGIPLGFELIEAGRSKFIHTRQAMMRSQSHFRTLWESSQYAHKDFSLHACGLDETTRIMSCLKVAGMIECWEMLVREGYEDISTIQGSSMEQLAHIFMHDIQMNTWETRNALLTFTSAFKGDVSCDR
jgi:hypothetical protein